MPSAKNWVPASGMQQLAGLQCLRLKYLHHGGLQARLRQVPDAEDPDPEVDNPGAEAVAGRLHGNGKGSLPVGEPHGCLVAMLSCVLCCVHVTLGWDSVLWAAGLPTCLAHVLPQHLRLQFSASCAAKLGLAFNVAWVCAGHRAGVSRGTGVRRGGGAGSSGAQGTRSRRTIRPPSRPFGDEFEDSLEPSDASEEVGGQAALLAFKRLFFERLTSQSPWLSSRSQVRQHPGRQLDMI
jgi:hypothetical protein